MDSKLVPTLICLLVVVIICLLMWWGWKNRQKRQSTYGNLAVVPDQFDHAEPTTAVEGIYVSTNVEGDWLDRIAVETLGYKSKATLLVYSEGIIFNREGAKDLWIPQADLRGVRTQSGMSGKFVEHNGLLVVTWSLNGKTVDTGFRTQVAEDKSRAEQAISNLLVH